MHDRPPLPPIPPRRQRRRLAAALALLSLPATAAAQTCTGETAPAGPDGRVLGHFRYGQPPADTLVAAPAALAVRGTCRVRAAVLADLERLVAAAAADPAAGGTLLALSCHRGIVAQGSVFCREADADAAERAVSVAPPGHSEHSTGYAVDFAIRPARGCRDAEACMATLPAARWLRAHARDHGFEQSFPAGNAQGVKWEPWHWRWVGARADTPGAADARATFAAARARFPADPGIVAPPRVVSTIAPPAAPPPAAEPSGRTRKRRR